MQTLRTTIDPTREITVDDREAADLEALGVVLKGTRATTDEGLTAAALKQTGATPDAPATPAPKKRAARSRAKAKTATPNTSTPTAPAAVEGSDTSTTAGGDTAAGTIDGGDAENKEG